MDNYLYPHFGLNIKRRALFRGITLVVLLVATISILYGVWGPILTPAVPDDLTAVRLNGGKGSTSWEYTVTDPVLPKAGARVFPIGDESALTQLYGYIRTGAKAGAAVALSTPEVAPFISLNTTPL